MPAGGFASNSKILQCGVIASCRFVCSLLGQRTELRVICEVSDGLEAVLNAEKLKPDLVLLNIGLPTLNGVAAARRGSRQRG